LEGGKTPLLIKNLFPPYFIYSRPPPLRKFEKGKAPEMIGSLRGGEATKAITREVLERGKAPLLIKNLFPPILSIPAHRS